MYKNILLIMTISLVTIVHADEINAITSAKSIAADNNEFAIELYHQIAKKEDGNIFYSPFSVSTALAMTYVGAQNLTEEEMSKVMHYGKNTFEFHQKYHHYLTRLLANAHDRIDLDFANRIWVQKDMKILEEFIRMNQDAYGSSLALADFINKSEQERLAINDYIAEKTNNRIKDLIQPGIINGDTRMVLANAIYFKGDWLHKFDSTKTRISEFKTIDKAKIRATFMNQEGAYAYHEADSYKMISLPYKGEKHSMIMVLPNDATGIHEVEKKIVPQSFKNLSTGYKPEVIISIPKFKTTIPLNLSNILKEMGMRNAFSSGADFSKITGHKDLVISEVIHKAFIEIDEKGTEAAAATAVVMMTTSTSMSPKVNLPKTFIADHPFIYYIVDNETGAILFMGRVLNPLN